MRFHLQMENFEGPIDALLQLIEKRKMPISDISLAKIADDYIQFVQTLEENSLSDITYFILVASTLTLIKSKSLLPNLELTEEEESDIDALKKRIELFKIYQEAGKSLKKNFSTQRWFYEAKPPKMTPQFQAHESLQRDIFPEILREIFQEIPKKENTKKEAYIKIAVHIEEMMESLKERITHSMKTTFHHFVNTQIKGEREKKKVKVYQVVSFLAMLELVKNGLLQVLQSKNFDEILITRPEEISQHYE